MPVIGDMMASRWAYEALAVEQAKNNRYDKNFYVYEQQKSEAQFRVSFLIPRLLNKLDECNRNLGVGGDQQILEANLALLKHEVGKLGNDHPDLFGFEHVERLNMNDFDQSYATDLEDWLTYASSLVFKDVARNATNQIDKMYTKLSDSLGSDAVFNLRQDHQNDRLEEQVTNYQEVTKILEIDGKLVQKGDPIYLIPESNFGRAHFYAPYKKFNDQLTDTKWFNLLVLWGFSFLVYIALLLDLFRKFIHYINSLKLQREAS